MHSVLQERKVKNYTKKKRVETTNFWVGSFFASLLLVNIGEPSREVSQLPYRLFIGPMGPTSMIFSVPAALHRDRHRQHPRH